jgi:uncharacterized protein YcbX
MPVGNIRALWRYPVKSMQGETITTAFLNEKGICGDRAYAIQDTTTGHIASAKYPGKWEALFACQAVYAQEPHPDKPLPPIRITLPDGTVISSEQSDIDAVLSQVLGREVTLITEAPAAPTREADRSDIDAPLSQRTIRQEAMAIAAPPGTFFDYAPVHILTTATLEHLRQLSPTGDFDVRRFRPNIVIDPSAQEPGFVENEWLGKEMAVGEKAALLHLIDPCPRCIITTLPQDNLPRNPGILRTVAQSNAVASVTLAPGMVFPAVVGVYANVRKSGVIFLDDLVDIR